MSAISYLTVQQHTDDNWRVNLQVYNPAKSVDKTSRFCLGECLNEQEALTKVNALCLSGKHRYLPRGESALSIIESTKGYQIVQLSSKGEVSLASRPFKKGEMFACQAELGRLVNETAMLVFRTDFEETIRPTTGATRAFLREGAKLIDFMDDDEKEDCRTSVEAFSTQVMEEELNEISQLFNEYTGATSEEAKEAAKKEILKKYNGVIGRNNNT